ncbi:MAG: hypothetical protein NWE80_03445 [Candidatus Bathyarchaeota archaeon]|nr:hypothetical protein [Candidatus Bathyarchaeota archaeon]
MSTKGKTVIGTPIGFASSRYVASTYATNFDKESLMITIQKMERN